MNKQVGRELKSLNIRDFFNSPAHRQAMGYFKHTAYKLNITQAELLKRLQSKSLEQINREYDYEKGNCMEIYVKSLLHKIEYRDGAGNIVCSCGTTTNDAEYELHIKEKE